MAENENSDVYEIPDHATDHVEGTQNGDGPADVAEVVDHE